MDGWVARRVVRGCRVKKRTKAVNISLQEVYLREDISCGSSACQSCCQQSPPLSSAVSHYLVPDVDAILQFWEVLELPQLTAVIFLASVLKEVQVRSTMRNWRRLKSLYTDRRRCNFYFDDEHFIYTQLSDKKGVDDIAEWLYEHLGGSISIVIMKGLAYHQSEAVANSFAEQFQKALSFKIVDIKTDVKVLSAVDYFGRFWSHDVSVTDLCNSLMQAQIEWAQERLREEGSSNAGDKKSKFGSGRPLIYNEHIGASAMEEGLAKGLLRAGIFHVSKHAPHEGFVRPSNKGEASKLEIFIPSRKLQNRALNGDLVAVRVIAHRRFKASKNEHHEMSSQRPIFPDLVDEDEATKLEENEVSELIEGFETEVEQDIFSAEAVIIGEVVGIIQRVQRDYVACLDETEEENAHLILNRQENLLCVPLDRRIPLVRVATRQRSRLVGQRFVIRIDGWDADSKIPRGHLVRVLGQIGDLQAENLALLVENDINVSPYSMLSLRELPTDIEEHPWVIPQEECAYRRDLRFCHRTCSIDPPGSKDVDDCLSVQHLSGNIIEVGVHIADVSYFVKEDSLLDLEALARGTTVYLVGNTYHMLPSVLSENLCSLREGKDRLAVSVIWTVDPENEFEILDTWFGRTIIHSDHQMSYPQAQAVLDSQKLQPGWEITGGDEEVIKLRADLSVLASFAQVCRSLRDAQGALDLASAELRFDVNEKKEPVHVETKLELMVNWIVAEMMIQANSFVARRIYETFPNGALLRCHPPPKLDNFSFLLKCCEARGFSFDVSSNKALAVSLDHLRDSYEPTVEKAFKALATRAMSEAEYISTGEVSKTYGFHHYGLALEFYTHFTSPIRRYADILVHRLLISSCKTHETIDSTSLERANVSVPVWAREGAANKDLTEMAHHLNERHRASKKAQKECNELHLLIYLEKHAQAEHGVVINVHQGGLHVFVPKYDLKGPVYLQDKNGNVIFPAGDDNGVVDNRTDEASPNIAGKYGLQYNEQSICILELNSGKICHKYERMTSVWVQLKADGSRAHSPTLRLQLLSVNHPAVIDVQEKRANQTSYPSKFGKTERKFKIGDIQADQVSSANERKQAEKATLALTTTKKQLTKDAQSTVKMNNAMTDLTVHDVLEKFEYLFFSASSIYPDFADTTSTSCVRETFIQSSNQQVILKPGESEGTGYASSYQHQPLVDYHFEITVGSEEAAKALLRNHWQDKLGKAAELRARYLRSTMQDESVRQRKRMVKELKARTKCHLLYWITNEGHSRS